MAKGRRQFRESEVLECLLLQGADIRCHRCKEPITLQQVRAKHVQKEHLHEFKLGGPDEPDNCRFSHTDCHSVITNGTAATSAGSSKNRIAKATHPNRTEKFVVRKTELAAVTEIDSGAKCRRCGEFETDCACPPPPERKSSFGSRSMRKQGARA